MELAAALLLAILMVNDAIKRIWRTDKYQQMLASFAPPGSMHSRWVRSNWYRTAIIWTGVIELLTIVGPVVVALVIAIART